MIPMGHFQLGIYCNSDLKGCKQQGGTTTSLCVESGVVGMELNIHSGWGRLEHLQTVPKAHLPQTCSLSRLHFY